MKIIALVPVKNEGWILPTYISSMIKIADEIIALDDNSDDDSRKILEDNKVFIIQPNKEQVVNMSQKRRLLLESGRKRGGTHFIWLDADESFDEKFLRAGRGLIEKMLPGQKISLPWITLWKSIDTERIDGVWKNNRKDVIVYDMPGYTFENKNLSEGRTQGPNNNIIDLDRKDGVILHFQFIDFDAAQAKQAWYRCIELLQNNKKPRNINNTYSVVRDTKKVITNQTQKDWFKTIQIPDVSSYRSNVFIKQILDLFEKHNILTFEPLDIWYIQELKDSFIKKTGRKPRIKVFPPWLILLNNIRKCLKR